MKRTLKIGLSACLSHPRPETKGLEGKTLQYLEQSVAQWIMARDVLVFMVPSITQDGMLDRSAIRLRDYAQHLDGLVLQGGADVNPMAYGESALLPEWTGDRTRDMYELELLYEFLDYCPAYALSQIDQRGGPADPRRPVQEEYAMFASMTDQCVENIQRFAARETLHKATYP